MARTLPTLRESLAGVDCDVHVTINEADPQTVGVVLAHDWIRMVDGYVHNRGLIRPVIDFGQRLFANYRYVLLTEDDCLHHVPKREYVELLEAEPWLAAASGFRCPYYTDPHEAIERTGRHWSIAAVTSVVDLLIRSERLQGMAPWPGEGLVGLDTWIFLNSPNALTKTGSPVACCDGVTHIGEGRSTWLDAEGGD